jgi:SAM-dependent methyltransferase
MPQPPLFDRALIARRLERRPSPRQDFVTALVVEDLMERLSLVRRRFVRAALVAPDPLALPAGAETAEGPFAFERVSTLLPAPGLPLVDPEALALPRTGYDLIVSLFDLHIVEDVPGFLSRLRAHLAPDGLLLAAAPGGETLAELRRAAFAADSALLGGAYGRVAPFIARGAAGGLLQRAGLALPVADVETHVVRYKSPFALLAELKALGATSPLFDRPRRAVGKP